MGFDSVTIRTEGGQTRVLTPEEFFRIPLAERVRLLCSASPMFVKNGRTVPATEALKRPA